MPHITHEGMDGILDAADEIRKERDELRARVAELKAQLDDVKKFSGQDIGPIIGLRSDWRKKVHTLEAEKAQLVGLLREDTSNGPYSLALRLNETIRQLRTEIESWGRVMNKQAETIRQLQNTRLQGTFDVATLTAHRACCGTEHDPANGKIHGYCVVCGIPWPCEYAGEPRKALALSEASQ